jgi:GNAT superfamily N-acetyltransferase
MAIDELKQLYTSNRINQTDTNAPNTMPRTTLSSTLYNVDEEHRASHPQSRPGPDIVDHPTTITLYTSQTLQSSGLVPQLFNLINNAFAVAHDRSGIMPGSARRLQSETQLINELSGPGTFTYLITCTSTNTIIGTASAKRYLSEASEAQVAKSIVGTFTRMNPSKESAIEWELATMAVDPLFQRQGVAELLMSMVEGEIKRQLRSEWGEGGKAPKMLLTTIKEVNGKFYAGKGYVVDYETWHGPGWLGSKSGFTVVHMSTWVKI